VVLSELRRTIEFLPCYSCLPAGTSREDPSLTPAGCAVYLPVIAACCFAVSKVASKGQDDCERGACLIVRGDYLAVKPSWKKRNSKNRIRTFYERDRLKMKQGDRRKPAPEVVNINK